MNEHEGHGFNPFDGNHHWFGDDVTDQLSQKQRTIADLKICMCEMKSWFVDKGPDSLQ